jgi:hypothetical protein
MTWTIALVTVPQGCTYTIVGGPDGQEGCFTPGYWFSSKAIIIVPGLGYIQFQDTGNSGTLNDRLTYYLLKPQLTRARAVPGGDWSVQVSGTNSSYWFYNGAGQATVAINADGSFKVTGGNTSVSGNVYAPWLLTTFTIPDDTTLTQQHRVGLINGCMKSNTNYLGH